MGSHFCCNCKNCFALFPCLLLKQRQLFQGRWETVAFQEHFRCDALMVREVTRVKGRDLLGGEPLFYEEYCYWHSGTLIHDLTRSSYLGAPASIQADSSRKFVCVAHDWKCVPQVKLGNHFGTGVVTF